MRINKLSFCNINSLAGQWEINFDHPAFSSEVFAIVGNTASGKTSILDAICLALYGETPRLRDNCVACISLNMSKCWSEVEFTLNGNRYKSRFEIDRKKAKKVNLSLIEPDNQVLTDKINEWKAQVESLTGLNMERFKQAIMLAQGEFRAFFEANEKQKAQILQNITGIDIYSQVEKAIFERYKRETSELTVRESVCNNLEVLSSEARQQIEQRVAQLKVEQAGLKEKLDLLKDNLTKLEQLASAQQEAAQKLQALQKAENEAQAFASQYGVLLRQAEKAAKVDVSFQLFTKSRSSFQEAQEKLQEAERLLPELQQSFEQSTCRLNDAQKLWQESKQKQKQAEPNLEIIESLEQQLLEENKNIQHCQASLAELLSTIKEKQQLVAKNKQEQEKLTRQLTDLQAWLTVHKSLSSLPAELSGLEQELQLLANTKQKLLQEQDTISKCQVELSKNRRQLAQLLQDQEKDQQQIQVLAPQKQELEQSMAGDDLSHYTSELNELNDKISQANSITERLRQYYQILQKAQNCVQQNQVIEGTLKAAIQQKLHCQEAVSKAQLQLENSEAKLRNFELQHQVQELQRQLKKGEACPVCGSLEHPAFTETNPLHNGDYSLTQKQYEAACAASKEALNRVSEELKQIEVTEGKYQTQLDNAEKMRDEAQNELSGLLLELDQACQNIGLLRPELENLEAVTAFATTEVKPMVEALTAEKNRLEIKQSQLIDRQKQLKSLTEQLTSLKEHGRDKAIQVAKLQAEQNSFDKQIQDFERLLNEDTEKVTVQQQQLQAKLSSYGLTWPQNETTGLSSLINELKRLNGEWTNYQEQVLKCNESLKGLSSALEAIEPQLASEDQKYQDRSQELQHFKEKAEALKRQIAEQLPAGVITSKDFRQLLQTAVDHQQTLVDKAASCCNQATQKYENAKTDCHNWRLQKEKSQTTFNEDAERFHNKLQEHGFATEATWQACQLSPENFAKWSSLEKQLNETKLKNEASSIDAEKLVAKRQAMITCQDTKEELASTLAETEKILETVSEEISTNTSTILADNKNQEKFGDLQKEYIQQKEVQAKWERLNNLAGQQDGTGKLVKYAQALSFNWLVVKANNYLQDLDNHYTLYAGSQLKDEKNNFELYVYDNKLSEMRPARNLSGGESFLVSLALALSLSEMAGGKSPIESLFIDEGFGTLDELTLEYVLGTLGSLQLGGRLIGLISHRKEITERITQKIQLIKDTNQRSIIKSGCPGCSCVKSASAVKDEENLPKKSRRTTKKTPQL